MMQEFWNTAMTTQMIPLQEWLLQGSVLNQHRQTLKHRLQGLCDNTESGFETFTDHEMVYTLRHENNSFTLYVRKALDHPDLPWHIRYLGNDTDKSNSILVRSCMESSVSQNIVNFLFGMGFRLDYEYVAKGYLFRRGKMRVTISTIFKMNQPGNTETSNLTQVAMSDLVELSVITSLAENVEQDMKNFADQLKPLINLEKMSHKHFVG